MWVACDILDDQIPTSQGRKGEKNAHKPNYADKCPVFRSSKRSEAATNITSRKGIVIGRTNRESNAITPNEIELDKSVVDSALPQLLLN